MDNEVAEIQDLNNSIELIKNTELGGSKLSDKKNTTNLYDHFPGLFTGVYSSSVFGNSAVPHKVRASRSSEQITKLGKYLSLRINKLLFLKNMLYSMRSVPDIEKMLSNFKFETTKTDNGNVAHDFVGKTDEFGKQLELTASEVGKIEYSNTHASTYGSVTITKHKTIGTEANRLAKHVLTGQKNPLYVRNEDGKTEQVYEPGFDVRGVGVDFTSYLYRG